MNNPDFEINLNNSAVENSKSNFEIDNKPTEFTIELNGGARGLKGDVGTPGPQGEKGEDGFSPSASVTKVGKVATITITDKDGTTTAEVKDGDGSGADPVWGNITGTLADQTDLKNALDSKADSNDIPTKTSDLTNDSGYITNIVNDLQNYYLKSNTYTKTEVDNLISAVSSMNIEVVQTLPTQDISTTTIYLVPKQTPSTQDVYDEYIYVNNAWEHIGSTEIDLTNYVQKTDYASTSEAGVIKTNTNYGTATDSGNLYSITKTYSQYQSSADAMFVGKGTLENVLTGKGYGTGTITSVKMNGSTIATSGEANLGTVITDISGKQDLIDSSHKLSSDLVDDTNKNNKFLTNTTQTIYGNKTFDDPVVLDNLTTVNGELEAEGHFYADGDGADFNCPTQFNDTATCLTPVEDNEIANKEYVDDVGATKQATLVSGTNIKTINNQTLLGSGNIGVQDTLVSGTNIKTINNTTLLGSGNIEVGADIPQQDNPPSNPQEDDLWIDTDDNTNLLVIDDAPSTTSTNAIQNQAITNLVLDQIGMVSKTVLYESTTGTTGNITLNDNISNYSFIEIYVFDSGNNFYFPAQKYCTDNKSEIYFQLNLSSNGNGGANLRGLRIIANGVNLTMSYFYDVVIVSGSTPSQGTSTNSKFKIYKVLGYMA